MKKIIIGFLILVGALGGCATTVPKNCAERATSELKMDIKVSSQATYLIGVDGYRDLKSASTYLIGNRTRYIAGVLVCTDDRILFIHPVPEKCDTMIEILHKDIVDVQVPAWGRGRRLVVKGKSEYFTFELLKGSMIDREVTYRFYRFIATKAGLEIKPGFEKKGSLN